MISSHYIIWYDEAVDDFGTVDNDGLTTFNISGTQDVIKLLRALQPANDARNLKIVEKERWSILFKRSAGNESANVKRELFKSMPL